MDKHNATAEKLGVTRTKKAAATKATPAAFAFPSLPGTDARDGTEDTHPLTELGNAKRLMDAHRGNVYYVPEAKAWLCWRSGRWEWDIDGAAIRSLAAKLPDQVYSEGSSHLADGFLFAKWARTSQREATIDAAVSLLRDFEQIRMPLRLVDANIFKAGLNDGCAVLDLTNGTTRPAIPADFITKTLNVQELGRPAKAVRWLAFLSQVFGDDVELIGWLKRWCGYLLSGSTREQFFLFCYGLGANGKSVFADILRFILGDYARAISSDTLTESKRQAGSATPDLAELIGARLAMSAETEDGAALAESLVKSLTAGDTMTVRKLYGDPIQFTPQFKLLMLGNHKPTIRGNDYGIWRRVRLIPFLRTFEPEERDPALLDKLKAEAPHILAWMVEGCIEWQLRGLSDLPTTIKNATGDYRDEQDYIGCWLAECCSLSPDYETSATVIYSSYRQWCDDSGLRSASKISLGRRLSERGLSCRQSNSKRLWAGLAVNASGSVETGAAAYKAASGR